MRRTVLLLTVMGLSLVLASGVALAGTFTGTKRADVIKGTERSDFIYGLNGDDTIDVTRASAEVSGGRGEDTIDANNGFQDEIYGGSDNDTIYARDNAFDYIDCGFFLTRDPAVSDDDTAYVDFFDEVVECETIREEDPPAAA